ncbi:MAG: toprim domain-containing protein [Mycoplasmataceae bacterium]|nr:toprim domain-containing protein [Mycoplasmataceae bacterium]
MSVSEISNLSIFFQKFSGIGAKQSKKMANQILKFNEDEFKEFLFLLNNLKEKVHNCIICQNYTIDETCSICSSKMREDKLMIVESIEDILRYEEWGIFQGKYFVFPILFNNDFSRKMDIDISKLQKYCLNFKEVVIALSATIEGTLTANFLNENLSEITKVSHLANGVPVGATIEYIDKLTFLQALKNRKEAI